MDYLAAPLTMLGVYLLGRKIKWGWLFAGVGSLTWCLYATTTAQWPLLALNLCFLYLDSRGFYLWNKDA